MAITKAKSAGKFKALPAPKSAPKKAMPKMTPKKMPMKKSAPKYDDRTGGMTGAPTMKQLQDKKFMAANSGKSTGKGMSMLKKAFGKK